MKRLFAFLVLTALFVSSGVTAKAPIYSDVGVQVSLTTQSDFSVPAITAETPIEVFAEQSVAFTIRIITYPVKRNYNKAFNTTAIQHKAGNLPERYWCIKQC